MVDHHGGGIAVRGLAFHMESGIRFRVAIGNFRDAEGHDIRNREVAPGDGGPVDRAIRMNLEVCVFNATATDIQIQAEGAGEGKPETALHKSEVVDIEFQGFPVDVRQGARKAHIFLVPV